MELHTTSEIINLAKYLENESAKFYERLSEKYTEHQAFLLTFARENRKNIIQIERAYYSVITDAIEGCFAFNVESDEYLLETEMAEKATYSDTLHQALDMEGKIVKFYSDAAEQSKSLMADVPRTFKMVAKKRNDRKSTLRLLLSQED